MLQAAVNIAGWTAAVKYMCGKHWLLINHHRLICQLFSRMINNVKINKQPKRSKS